MINIAEIVDRLYISKNRIIGTDVLLLVGSDMMYAINYIEKFNTTPIHAKFCLN